MQEARGAWVSMRPEHRNPLCLQGGGGGRGGTVWRGTGVHAVDASVPEGG